MKKVGLALGSGAARGIAHIGVIQVLLEHNIPIDYVSGCSMGAVIGAIFCTGSDMYTLGKMASTITERMFFDVTLPKYGLLKGKKAEELVALLTKNYTFEQCKIPFVVAACDLVSAKTVALNTGNIARAVRASFSVPGVFEPVRWGDMLLVDGGVTDRVPVDLVKDMGAEYVIAVDVNYRGWERKMPTNVIETLFQAFETIDWCSVQHIKLESDVLIVPDVTKIDFASLTNAEECLENGRKAALEKIDQIKKDLGL